jgi:hypothetical protein
VLFRGKEGATPQGDVVQIVQPQAQLRKAIFLRNVMKEREEKISRKEDLMSE